MWESVKSFNGELIQAGSCSVTKKKNSISWFYVTSQAKIWRFKQQNYFLVHSALKITVGNNYFLILSSIIGRRLSRRSDLHRESSFNIGSWKGGEQKSAADPGLILFSRFRCRCSIRLWIKRNCWRFSCLHVVQHGCDRLWSIQTLKRRSEGAFAQSNIHQVLPRALT